MDDVIPAILMAQDFHISGSKPTTHFLIPEFPSQSSRKNLPPQEITDFVTYIFFTHNFGEACPFCSKLIAV